MDRLLQLTRTYILLGAIALVGILAVACPSPDDSTTDDTMPVEPPPDTVVTEPVEPEPMPNIGDIEGPDELAPLEPKDQFEPLEFVSNVDCDLDPMNPRLTTRERFFNSELSNVTMPVGVTIDVTSSLTGSTNRIGAPLFVLAEVADHPQLRNQGLMCRSRVPEREGMLFLWPDEDPPEGMQRRFWMWNTYVPLDILYIREDGSTDRFFTMTPCPRNDGEAVGDWSRRCTMESRGGDRTTQCEGYQSCGSDIVAALELPAGWLEETLGRDLTESAADLASITVSWDLNRIIVPGETP